MAKIISLGCEVADIYRRYASVHGALFGLSSFRVLKNALAGKRRDTYEEHLATLEELRGLLMDVERRISECGRSDLSFRRAEELRDMMLSYTATLTRVVAELSGICTNLARDERSYRNVDAVGLSRFNQDKISYDRALSQLENQGTKLNRLFSSY